MRPTSTRSHSRAGSKPIGYRPEFDGIRALAILAVMVYHSSLYQSRFRYKGGYLGVDVFFVLSGYLITTLLLQEASTNRRISFGGFYGRRALRLLPALGVAIILGAVLITRERTLETPAQYFRGTIPVIFYAGNWTLSRVAIPLRHTWSLALEEQYYLVWPAVLWYTLKRSKRLDRVALWVAGAAVAVAIVRCIAFAAGHQQLAFYSTIGRGDGVLWGSALAIGLYSGNKWLAQLVNPRVVAIAGFAIVGATSLVVSDSSRALSLGVFTLADLATAAVIGHLAVRPGEHVARALSWQPLPAIGRISYGLYLFHGPIFFLIHGLPPHRLGIKSDVVAFVATFAFSIGSYLAIERPALMLKRRFTPRGRRPPSQQHGLVESIPGVVLHGAAVGDIAAIPVISQGLDDLRS